ncbi:MAG: transposase [Alkaliphilus sp.]
MPRVARRYSESQIYHIMIRGNERKDIFLDEEDKEFFLEIMEIQKDRRTFNLYAYCLMDNHVHLVLDEGDEYSISEIMKAIQVSYVVYFNKKYSRTGHLFQGRFRSEAVEDDGYLLAVTRYVHNNPVEAKIVNNAHDFRWSSYNIYIDGEETNYLISKARILNYFGNKTNASITASEVISHFVSFTSEKATENFIEYKMKQRVEKVFKSKKDVVSYLERYLLEKKIELDEISKMKEERDELVQIISGKSNLSIREIATLLKMNRSAVHAAIKRSKQ